MPPDPTPPAPAPDPARGWTVRRYRLGEEPRDPAGMPPSAEARLELLAQLSARFWELTGRPVPALPRSRWPITRQRRA